MTKKCQKFYTVAKNNPRKNLEWTNNSQQHCVIQIVIEKLAVHSKSQERAKKSLIFGRGKTSMIHDFGHAKFQQCAIGRFFWIVSYKCLCNFFLHEIFWRRNSYFKRNFTFVRKSADRKGLPEMGVLLQYDFKICNIF